MKCCPTCGQKIKNDFQKEGFYICNHCKQWKHESKFTVRHGGNKRHVHSYCKDCNRKKSLQYQLKAYETKLLSDQITEKSVE